VWNEFMAAAPKKTGSTSKTGENESGPPTTRLSSRAIKQYLEALESNKPKRGRKRTPDSIAKRLERIDEELETASQVKKLTLTQERIDLNEELVTMEAPVDMSAIEDEFVEAAKAYGERKGITYAAWREVGVPAAVLKRAGISRGA
jgi:uncharacterized protein YicC (UPF0701 family)